VVHSDHASILHCYGDMAPQILHGPGHRKKDGRMERERRRGRRKESKRKVKKKKGKEKRNGK